MKKALVVDDTKNIRMLLTTCLEVNDFTVITASNGREALELLEKEKFDIAFLDIKLPEVSGTEILRRIRAEGVNVPVVIMTAFGTIKNAVECTKLGAVAYLQKPFTADKIKNLLQEFYSLENKSNDIAGLVKKGREFILENKEEEALSCLKKALSIDPACGEIYYYIGRIYEIKGDKEKASKFYLTARNFGYIN
ncbi:response regulator [Fonticella tunisiensis]|uniref:Stage 0 sporulation protein A homolog n=1 Tax=Fonticella tunisiensis TaxID=1096341 RepID=A0A4R7KBL3_9CLOT|nr:response regulator [Fonticella tunisiensis]TDT52047.1 tetratricopeptide repeat protein [Fonticella tunisiensis]